MFLGEGHTGEKTTHFQRFPDEQGPKNHLWS